MKLKSEILKSSKVRLVKFISPSCQR